MAATFRESISKIVPSWLRGPNGTKFLYALTIPLDAATESLVQGVMARMPGIGTPEALPYTGRDRQIDRAPNESDESYAARLRQSWDTWRVAGNARTVLSQVATYFLPLTPVLRSVNQNGVWTTLDTGAFTRLRATPTNWNWDGLSTRWWRAWVVIYSPDGAPFQKLGTWGDGKKWGQTNGTWGSTATPSQVAGVRALVRKWKDAEDYVPNIMIVWDEDLFDPAAPPGDASLPDGTWGRWSKYVGGVQVRARSADAIYWDGVE